MKRMLACLLMLVTGGLLFAETRSVTMMDESGLSYSKTTDIDTNSYGFTNLSCEVVFGTKTYTSVAWTDGYRSTGTIRVLDNTKFSKGRIAINGVSLTEGVDFSVGNKSSNTATNINAAINANTAFTDIIATSLTAGQTIIYATATAVGTAYNYTKYSSSPTGVNVLGFTTGRNSSIDYVNDIITSTNYSLDLALPVKFVRVTGTAPTNLTTQTTYFVIPLYDSAFKLSKTSTGAVAGLAIDIVKAAADGNSTFTSNPVAFTGTAGFALQASNNGTDYFTAHASSVTFTNATSKPGSGIGTGYTVFWSFTPYPYRYFRLNYSKPTFGGSKMKAYINGK